MADTEFNGFSVVAIIILIASNVVFLLFAQAVFDKICKCCSLRGPLFCSNRSGAVGHKDKSEEFMAWDILDNKHVVRSHFGPPIFTLCVRIFAFGYFWFTIIYQGAAGSGLDAEFLGYFTNWTFILFGAYGLVGVVVSGAHIGCSLHSKRTVWHPAEKLLCLLVEMVSSLGLMLSLFYWAAVYDGETIELDNPLKHGINAVVMVVEVMLSRVPFVSSHMWVLMAYGTVYCVFMWCAFAVNGHWKYSALDWTKSSSPGYYIVLPILVLLSYFAFYGIACLREYLGSGLCPCKGNTSKLREMESAQFESMEMAQHAPHVGEGLEAVDDGDDDSMESVDLEAMPQMVIEPREPAHGVFA